MSDPLRIERFALDLASPLSTAHGDIDTRTGFVVGLDVDGARGVGEAAPLPDWTESEAACRAALEEFRNALAALDAPSLDDVAATLSETLDPRARPAAHHGVSLALADARARRSSLPLAAWLCAEADTPRAAPAERVPVNATVGGAGSLAERVERAERAVAEGYDCLKLKVGLGNPDQDVALVRRVRDAVGPDVTLRADANGAWDHDTARDALAAFARYDVAYVEQPLPADDVEGLAALREVDADVGVAADESIAAHGVDAILDAGAADVLILKPMALGGPVRTVEIARRAREVGVTPVITTTVDAAIARTAAVHVAASIPEAPACGLATGGLLAEDLGADPVPVEDGAIRVPDRSGIAGGRFDSVLW